MNSLEFIDLEIARTKSKYKEHIKFGQTAFAIKDEKRLNTLQQIKVELEAWYVVKPKIKIKEIADNGFFSKDYYRKYWTCYEYGVRDKEQVEKIEKALEVKNDN